MFNLLLKHLHKCTIPTIFSTSFSINQRRWLRKATQRSRVPSTATQEQLRIRTKLTRSSPRLVDFLSNPESAYTIARRIRGVIANRVLRYRRKKDFKLRNRHRVFRKGGIIKAKSKTEHGDSVVTPLTQLQHLAKLPPTTRQRRFNFPHSLHYKCFWGPPQTYRETGYTSCCVSVRLKDLRLNAEQEKKLLSVIGFESYNKKTGIFCLKSSIFDTLNHNAAYLGKVVTNIAQTPIQYTCAATVISYIIVGDILQRLVIEVKRPQ